MITFRCNFEKINFKEGVRCVPAYVVGWCTGMDPTNVMQIQPVS